MTQNVGTIWLVCGILLLLAVVVVAVVGCVAVSRPDLIESLINNTTTNTEMPEDVVEQNDLSIKPLWKLLYLIIPPLAILFGFAGVAIMSKRK